MAKVARGDTKDTVNTLHGCTSSTTTDKCSDNVFVNGTGIHRVTDTATTHTYPPNPPCPTHTPPLESGSPDVYANGLQVGRVGDPYTGCGVISSGSSNVFANGG